MFSDLCLLMRFCAVMAELFSGFVKLVVMGLDFWPVEQMMFYLIFSAVGAVYFELALMGLVLLSSYWFHFSSNLVMCLIITSGRLYFERMVWFEGLVSPFFGLLFAANLVMCVIGVLYSPDFFLCSANLMLLFSDLCLLMCFFALKTQRFVELMMYYLICSSVYFELALMGLVLLSHWFHVSSNLVMCLVIL